MRHSFTAVIEKNATFHKDFETEPYECAWASEARWFVHVLEMGGVLHSSIDDETTAAFAVVNEEATSLSVRVQVSPDGLTWCDEGTQLGASDDQSASYVPIFAPGLYSVPLRDFGGWLRLDCSLRGVDPRIRLMIYLVLKE